MSQEPKHYLTSDEALAIAAEIKTTPGCEFDKLVDARASGEAATGYVVEYWPLREDGSRKNYGMRVYSRLEWDNLKRIALAHEAKRQRKLARLAQDAIERSAEGKE